MVPSVGFQGCQTLALLYPVRDINSQNASYSQEMFCLVDCNNFFVSCERVFNPRLLGRPVVVLSNNDGCVVACSNEAKSIGVKRGQPFFQIRQLAADGHIQVCSGNIVLYGDMSKRVMSVVSRFVPDIEVYSIDECFADFSGVENPAKLGQEIAATVQQWTGIPVSIGVAQTRTLAKVAGRFAKKYPGYRGCCVIDTEEKRMKALQLTAVKDVWGIGRRHASRLENMAVQSALDLAAWEETRVHRVLGLPGLRTWQELQGHAVIQSDLHVGKKSLTESRSFKSPVTDFEELRAIIADFAADCARRLRRENGVARRVTTYICTDRFRQDQSQYDNSSAVSFEVPTHDLREIVSAAARNLEAIYRDGYGYKKAGVLLTDISHGNVQAHLFDPIDRKKQERLLEKIDLVQQNYGAGTVKVASQSDAALASRREYRSPCYTTDLRDIIVVT